MHGLWFRCWDCGDDAIIVCVANLVWLVCRSFLLLVSEKGVQQSMMVELMTRSKGWSEAFAQTGRAVKEKEVDVSLLLVWVG